MASAKLSGSLLVYKDLPSATLTQHAAPASRSTLEATATAVASPAADGNRRLSGIIGISLASSAITAASAAALFFFIHMTGQTAAIATVPSTSALSSPSVIENPAVDRSAQLAPPQAMPTDKGADLRSGVPLPEANTAPAEESQRVIAGAPEEPVPNRDTTLEAAPNRHRPMCLQPSRRRSRQLR